MSRSSQAREVLTNATLISIEMEVATNALDVALAGWPEQTPGASTPEARPPMPCTDEQCTHIQPCPVHAEEPVELTAPERAVVNHDQARIDLDRLDEHLRQLVHHARAAAAITHRWAHDAITATEVAERLDAIWCRNCLRHGVHNPRDGAHRDCKPCRDFRSRWKGRDAPKAIIDARGRRRLSLVDEKRILDRDRRELDEADRAAERRAQRAKRTG